MYHALPVQSSDLGDTPAKSRSGDRAGAAFAGRATLAQRELVLRDVNSGHGLGIEFAIALCPLRSGWAGIWRKKSGCYRRLAEPDRVRECKPAGL